MAKRSTFAVFLTTASTTSISVATIFLALLVTYVVELAFHQSNSSVSITARFAAVLVVTSELLWLIELGATKGNPTKVRYILSLSIACLESIFAVCCVIYIIFWLIDSSREIFDDEDKLFGSAGIIENKKTIGATFVTLAIFLVVLKSLVVAQKVLYMRERQEKGKQRRQTMEESGNYLATAFEATSSAAVEPASSGTDTTSKPGPRTPTSKTRQNPSPPVLNSAGSNNVVNSNTPTPEGSPIDPMDYQQQYRRPSNTGSIQFFDSPGKKFHNAKGDASSTDTAKFLTMSPQVTAKRGDPRQTGSASVISSSGETATSYTRDYPDVKPAASTDTQETVFTLDKTASRTRSAT